MIWRSAAALCLTLLALTLARTAHALTAEFVAASEPMLSNPHDIDLSPDGKYVYVSDLGNDRIAVLDADTLKFVGSFGEKDGLSAPHDAHMGPDGRLYVADTGRDRIVVYKIDGATGEKASEITGGIDAPEGALAHADGRVYATGARSGNIVAYENGKVAAETKGLHAPHDVAAAKDGNLWVADSGNDRMLLMSRDLKILKELKDAPYNFSGPRYQDIMDDGVLIVADKNTHTVKFIAADGKLLATIGTGRREKGPGKFATPEGVVVRGLDLWLSDSGNDRVVRYRIVP